ncbi:unnamed protein product [Echinostoma caproni]|uniref:Calpain_III domain-containing protein n=1 Tax=Echinostoma caproni TaxID=27848 RepID=A0A183BEB9_9TREM|nr:unnamed protein product [Echinostoma caproni]
MYCSYCALVLLNRFKVVRQRRKPIDENILGYFTSIHPFYRPNVLLAYVCSRAPSWLAGEGPKKDSYSSANNPQYNLEVRSTVEAPIWILLTRHITDKADFADNKEFIAVVVYKNITSRKVYYPYDPEPFRDSVRINSPHCLVQLLQDAGTVNYTLVISQYEKSNTIHYTLRVYSTAPFVLCKILDPYKVEKQVNVLHSPIAHFLLITHPICLLDLTSRTQACYPLGHRAADQTVFVFPFTFWGSFQPSHNPGG